MTDVNFPQDFYCDDVGVWRLKKEKLAELNKPKQMTNEEYLKSCNTEQFAEALAWIEDRGELPTVRKENVKAFEEWLKKPHKE